MNIYVGNLSLDATDESIREAFESFGRVASAKVIKGKDNGQSRGFAFVEMPESAQAQEAMRSLNGKELMGKPMSVRSAYAPANQRRSGRQGGRMDYRGRRYDD